MKILLCLLLPWLGVTGVPIPAHVSVLTGALPQGVKFWGGLSIPPHHLSRPSSPKSGGRDETSGSVGVIPAEWDSRAHEAFRVCWGSLSSVQEQGNCGASWAIVAGQQYRDSLCTSGGKNKTLPDAELSAFDALTCATSTAVAFGCGGAVLTAGFEFFKQEGVCQATCKAYPWQKQDQGPGKDEADTPKCVPMCDKPAPSGSGGAGAGGREAEYKREKAARVLTSYGTLGWGKDAADPAKVKREVMLRGSVASEFAFYPSFGGYAGGVYSPSEGEAPTAGSAVRIVGWGQAAPGECWWKGTDGERHETAAEGCKYWVAVPTAGASFGEGGSFRVQAGKAIVGSSAVYAMV